MVDVNFIFRVVLFNSDSQSLPSKHTQSSLPFAVHLPAPLPFQCTLLIPANHVMVSAQRALPPNPFISNRNVQLSVTRELARGLFILTG